jgi:amidase
MGKHVDVFDEHDALGRLDAVGIAEAIAAQKISAAEAVEAAIRRAEKANPDLNAIVIKMFDDGRKMAQSNVQGGFFGVPSFIKDSDPIAGYPTQMGTGVFKAKPARSHGKFVNQFLSAGLICLGKSTLPEFGLICSTENERWGITRNPWNTDYTTGGSSSGSAALVASGVVPIASANDGAGSIRIPAAICGLVGLKPSRHRLHGVDGTEAMPIQIVHQGVLTRSVRDTAFFYAEAEKYYRNPHLPPMGYVKYPLKKRLRIAFIENQPKGKIGYQDEDVRKTQVETARLLESLGHYVEEIPMPVDAEKMASYFLNYYGFLAYMLTHWSKVTLKAHVNRHLLEPFTEGLALRFKENALKLPSSIRVLKKTAHESAQLFQRFDVIMSPVLAHKTPKIGYFSPQLPFEEITRRAVDFAAYCGLYNVTGAPAISLPLGVDSNNMPVGVQFGAAYGNDALLLELAYQLEAARPWRMIYDRPCVNQPTSHQKHSADE